MRAQLKAIEKITERQYKVRSRPSSPTPTPLEIFSSPDAGLPESSSMPEKMPFAILTFDGESPQIKSILSSPQFLDPAANLHALKLSAACSMAQQANDLMRCFNLLRRYYKSKESRILRLSQIQKQHYVGIFEKHLRAAGMDNKSIYTYTHFVALLHYIVSKAYTVGAVYNGWKISGLAGTERYDIQQIMSQWPGWDKLTPQQQQKVLGRIKEMKEEILTSKVEYTGEILDSYMESKLKEFLGPANPTRRHCCSEVGAYSVCVNQWRALYLCQSFHDFLEKRREDRKKKAKSNENQSRAESTWGTGMGPDMVATRCGGCGNVFTRRKYERTQPPGWSKCTCCPNPYWY